MAATASESWLFETEQERVEKWRARELARAGYPAEIAVALASNAGVDLHRACDLLERGCPLSTALEILT